MRLELVDVDEPELTLAVVSVFLGIVLRYTLSTLVLRLQIGRAKSASGYALRIDAI